MFSRFSRIKWSFYFLLLLLALSRFYDPIEKIQNRILVFIFNPFLEATYFVSQKMDASKKWLLCQGNICEENQKLKEELEYKSLRLIELESLLQTQKNLEKLQKFSLFADYEKIPAKVLAYNPSELLQTLRINIGKKQGISLGAPVIVPEGLVGIVSEVYEESAVVNLATDTHFQVSAVIKGKTQRGIAKGYHKKMDFERYFAMNRLDYLQNSLNTQSLSQLNVQENDEVLTSGLDGFFPQGIPLGKISKILRDEKSSFLSAELLPEVDFLNLETVLVLKRKAVE